ncbi:MAG: signal recognition particle-docking protein FtsY [Verrucomicrobiota bacterium]|nr:signal recognition particle-docking protein FtsY [Verrucomicrobiota bacterium]
MLNFFKKVLSPFARLKSTLGRAVTALFSKGKDDAAYDDLERLLYEADLGAELAAQLVADLRKKDPEDPVSFLKARLLALFPPPSQHPVHSPHIVLVVGVNGSGKTTTLAKLASKYHAEGKKVLLAAADTFRAAAIEQLETWALKIGVDLIKGQPKSDPSAVAYDAISAALARKADIVFIDTAGRLQTKTDLMHELSKIRRVIQKLAPSAPHETLLVLDATIGQNAIDQAKVFHQFTPITGIVLTKLDGSAKGGIAAALQQQLKIPILWAGLGESEADLVPFNAQDYVNALFQ